MPKQSFSDQLANAFVAHDVNVLRLQADQRRTLFKALKKLEAKLVKAIAATDTETVTLARSKALLKTVRTLIDRDYATIASTHKVLLQDLAEYEFSAVGKLINREVGVSLMSIGVDEAVIKSLVSDDVVIGAPLKTYWEQQSVGLRNRFMTEMRAGVFAGETPQQLIQRVRGTKAQNFRNGIMQTARNGAEVVTRTAAQSVLNDARMEVFKANADVIEGVQAQVTLDDRTSDVCIARSGFAWTLDGDPFPGTDTDEDFPGPPPWHPNCRSTLLPLVKRPGQILKDNKLDTQLQREVANIPKATQASMNGQVAGELTYEQWLETQSTATQLEVLGPGRLKLWNAGKIN